jgi:hypothetical protein
MGADLDLEDGGVVRARERGEGLSTAETTLLLGRQLNDLLDRGQMGIIPALGPGLARSLPAWP